MMYKAYTENEYDTYLKELKTLLPDDNAFLKYFLKNWDSSRQVWTPFGRALSPYFGVRTTNHVESHNSLLKKHLGKTTSLKECIMKLVMVSHQSSTVADHRAHLIRCKQPNYHVNSDTETYKNLLGKMTDYSLELVLKQELFSSHASTATLERYQTTTESCECNFFRGVMLPCYHLMYLRRCEGQAIVTEADIMQRWLLNYQFSATEHIAPVDNGISAITVKNKSKAPMSGEAKYNTCLRECKDICSALAQLGGSAFEEGLMQLQNVKNLILKDGGFKAFPLSGIL
jgi:IS1 family transposase